MKKKKKIINILSLCKLIDKETTKKKNGERETAGGVIYFLFVCL